MLLFYGQMLIASEFDLLLIEFLKQPTNSEPMDIDKNALYLPPVPGWWSNLKLNLTRFRILDDRMQVSLLTGILSEVEQTLKTSYKVSYWFVWLIHHLL